MTDASKPAEPIWQRISGWLVGAAIVAAFLFFTPIGGYVSMIVGGSAFLAAIYLLFLAAGDLLSFSNYSYAPHWRGIGLKIIGAVALFGFTVALFAILPPRSLRGSHDPDYCIDTISNPC